MGDAVRRVQKHLQDLSRDHLTSVEDRHHANLGWLQIELQQLCKQIEVEVRVELTRPPRLSFSKAPLLPPAKDAEKTAAVSTSKPKTPLLPSPLQSAATRLVFDAVEEDEPPRVSKKRPLDGKKTDATVKQAPEVIVIDGPEDADKPAAVAHEPIDLTSESISPEKASSPLKKVVKRTVKKTRTVLKPKKVIKKVKKLVKEEKKVLPQVDVSALKVVDLKAELKKRGLKQTGVKAVLAKRLLEALAAEDAAQMADEELETSVTEEVEEEIMEEVEEEYEEEIEEEGEEPTVKTSPSTEKIVESESSNPAAVQVPAVDDTVVEEPQVDDLSVQTSVAPETEAERTTLEDVNIVPAETEKLNDQLSRRNSIQADSEFGGNQKSSPKDSLSDIVPPIVEDEIVRESDAFLSPDGKLLPRKSGSTRKSPRRKSSVNSRNFAAKSDQMNHPISKVTKQISESPASHTPPTSVPEIALSADQRHQETLENVSESTGATKEVSLSVIQEENQSSPVSENSTLLSQSKTEDSALSSQLSSETAAPADSAAKDIPADRTEAKTTTSTSQAITLDTPIPPVMTTLIASDSKTPSRDLMERVKSLASSSRSSSISSLSAVRRYTGSISYVEDSQPDQSPLRPSYAPELPSQSARAASLDISSITSMLKTPDSAGTVVPTTERVAHSEPRHNTVKEQVENEEERKRREQQENIQREAQRLRMAMKQSARKRFEEAKSSSLFWPKRDVAPLQIETPATTDSSRTTESTGSASVTPRESDPVPVEQPRKEAKSTTSVNADTVNEGPKDQAIKPGLSASVTTTTTQTTKSQGRADEPKGQVVETKRPMTRKRSSILVDSSAFTLYPSKKRASLGRGTETEVSKRSSLSKSISAPEVLRKRSSTERENTVDESVPKRKRSSLTRGKGVEPVTSKRKSLRSSQDQPSSQIVPTSSDKGVQKAPASTRIVAPSTLKRRESVSSTISSSSSVSASDVRPKPTAPVLGGGAVRKPTNLVSGLHSFTTLLEKDSANLSSSQGSNSSSRAPGVSALKQAEKSRLLEQKKLLEKAKRKEALAKKYEEQRKADEGKRKEQRKLEDEKKKKYAQMKEKAEREARLKREQEQATEKKQRELELAKKRQQRLQEMRSGMEKKKALGSERDQAAVPKSASSAVPVSRIAGATISSLLSQSSKTAVKSAQAATTSAEPRELTTYAMSENEESSGSEDEKDTERNSKNIPKWAQREHLERALRIQFGPNAIDPTPSIFPDFVDSCDLEAIFEPTDVRKKKRFQRRTSSGNWLGDRPTAREKAVYKKDMGFVR